MTKDEFIAWAKERGWVQDRHGHLHKEIDGREYRYKIQAHSVRREAKVRHEATEYSPASSSWVRMKSAYFKDLSLDENGKLKGMKRRML